MMKRHLKIPFVFSCLAGYLALAKKERGKKREGNKGSNPPPPQKICVMPDKQREALRRSGIHHQTLQPQSLFAKKGDGYRIGASLASQPALVRHDRYF